MPRRYSPYASSFSFGPGPLSTAMKGLIGANVVVFLAQTIVQPLTGMLGLQPLPTYAETGIWLLYVVPMLTYVLWPATRTIRLPRTATSSSTEVS